MKIFSFRGDHKKLPENTLVAFQEALQNGAEGIAMEVHMTRDREPIIFRSESLGRLTDAVGLVRHHDLQEIQEANFNDPYAKFHQHIPSLREYLAWAAHLPHTTILLLTNDSFYAPNLEEEVMARIIASEARDRVVIATAQIEVLRRIRAHYPKAKLAWITDAISEESVEIMEELQISWILLALVQVSSQIVSFCHERGLKLLIRIVTTNAQVEQMEEFGVDAILTQDLPMARASLGEPEMPFSPEQLDFVLTEADPKDESKPEIQTLAQRAKRLAGKKNSRGKNGNILAVILSMLVCVAVASLVSGLLMNIVGKFFH